MDNLIEDPRQAALLGFGLRLMSTPGKFGPAIGTAGLGAMQDARQAKAMQVAAADRALQQQMMQQQLAEIQRQQKEREAAQARRDKNEELARRLVGMPQYEPMPAGQMGPGAPVQSPGIDLRQFLQQGGSLDALPGVASINEALKPPARKIVATKPGEIGRDEYGNEVWSNAPEEKDDDLAPILKRAGIDPNSPLGKQMYLEYARKKASHAPAANATVVLPTQEKEENKAVGKYFGEQYADLQKSGLAAGQTIGRLGQLKSLLQGVETGSLTPLATDIAGYARSFGIDLDPKLDTKQAIAAMANEMALQMRNPAGGAGMPGALSDKDREFLVQIVPGLAKTPGGNALIIDARTRLAQREQVIARMARDYRARKKTLDEGFYEELQQYADAHPLFDDIAPVRGGTDLGNGFRLKGK